MLFGTAFYQRIIPAKLNSSDPIPLVPLIVLLTCVGTVLSRTETAAFGVEVGRFFLPVLIY